MSEISFATWSGQKGIEQFIINQTGCKPYSGAGINPRIKQKTTILKSVDNTPYYADDMSDINNIKYTLFGKNGNQDENEKRFNEPLLNKNKTHNIYLYRVKTIGRVKEYIWYGRYEIIGRGRERHIGEDEGMRSVIVIYLRRLGG